MQPLSSVLRESFIAFFYVAHANPENPTSPEVEQQELRTLPAVQLQRLDVLDGCSVSGFQRFALDGHIAFDDMQPLPASGLGLMRKLFTRVELAEVEVGFGADAHGAVAGFAGEQQCEGIGFGSLRPAEHT